MSFDNLNNDVQLFFANDKDGNIAIIYDLQEQDRNKKYTCPVCDSEVKPVCIDYKTKSGELSQISPHFSHVDSSKCTVETRIHFWVKNKFLMVGDKFTVVTDKTTEYVCKEILIEEACIINDKKYIPDITIITECGETVFFELSHTNKKKVKDYLEIWDAIGNIVIEVDTKTLINVSKVHNYMFDALYYKGKCFDKAKNNLYNETIGTYKNNHKINLSEETKEKIKRLDWFWREVINYKKGESDIELLTNLVDYNDEEYRKIIFRILSKKSCVPIYEDYINYKIILFYNNAIEYLNTYENGLYNQYFGIDKFKEGRKYKNIPYNRIIIESTYNSSYNKPIKHVIDITQYSMNMMVYLINNIINSFNDCKVCFDRSNFICSTIKDKYVKIRKGLRLYINPDYSENVFNNIILSETPLYSSNLLKICILKNSIIINNEDKMDIDIMDKNNDSKIINFISDHIDVGIKEYRLKEILKKRKAKEGKKLLLLEIQQEKKEFNDLLHIITDYFDNNKNIILKYNIDYSLRDKYNNMLYFKDYRGFNYVIHSGKYYIHADDAKNKYGYFNFTYYSNCTPIVLGFTKLGENENIFIHETLTSYKITKEVDCLTRYIYEDYINKKIVNLSFRKYNNPFIYLPRYDFVKVTSDLNNIMKKVMNYQYEYMKTFSKNMVINNKQIIKIQDITNDDINKEIYRLLYPIIFQADRMKDDELNLTLNVDYTKRQPWLIKDFITAMSNVGIKNLHNII